MANPGSGSSSRDSLAGSARPGRPRGRRAAGRDAERGDRHRLCEPARRRRVGRLDRISLRRPDGRGHRRRTGTASVSARSGLRDLSAVRVLALVATCALHAAAFLALMRPPPPAPRLPSQRMTVVLIDLSGVEATPPAAPAPLAAAAPTLPEPRRPSPKRTTTRTAAPTPTAAPVAPLPVAADEAAQSQPQHDVAEATVREDPPAEASASASARDGRAGCRRCCGRGTSQFGLAGDRACASRTASALSVRRAARARAGHRGPAFPRRSPWPRARRADRAQQRIRGTRRRSRGGGPACRAVAAAAAGNRRGDAGAGRSGAVSPALAARPADAFVHRSRRICASARERAIGARRPLRRRRPVAALQLAGSTAGRTMHAFRPGGSP